MNTKELEKKIFDLEDRLFALMEHLIIHASRYQTDEVNAIVNRLKLVDREYRDIAIIPYVNWVAVNNIVLKMNYEIEAINNAKLKIK